MILSHLQSISTTSVSGALSELGIIAFRVNPSRVVFSDPFKDDNPRRWWINGARYPHFGNNEWAVNYTGEEEFFRVVLEKDNENGTARLDKEFLLPRRDGAPDLDVDLNADFWKENELELKLKID